MVRIQIARDQAMAQVAAEALRAAPPGSTVLLLAGAQHASRDRGVPLHLQREIGADAPPMQVVMFGDARRSGLAPTSGALPFHAAARPLRALRKRLAAPRRSAAR